MICIGLLCSDKPGWRAMTAISALHLAAPGLGSCAVRTLGAVTPNVDIALQALAYDTGMDVQPAAATREMSATAAFWRQADLAIGISRNPLPRRLIGRALQKNVALIAAVEDHGRRFFFRSAGTVPRIYAYDTRALADLILAADERKQNEGMIAQHWLKSCARERVPQAL